MAYVDAEKLKKNVRVNLMPNVDVDGTVTVENAERYFLNLIDKTSTADVTEVIHAKWEISSDGYYPYCTNCKTEPKNGVRSKYCPECGSRMDGEK